MAGNNLFSCGLSNDKIYKHVGFTAVVSLSFAAPNGMPSGLTTDGTNLWSCDFEDDEIYGHDQFTSTVNTTLTAPNTSPTGMAFDGTNLWNADIYNDEIYGHSGVTATVSTTLTAPGSNTMGLTFDGTNLWSAAENPLGDSLIYGHDGVTSSINTTLTTPGTVPRGMMWYSGNLWSSDSNSGEIYGHNGATTTVNTTISAPDGTTIGLTLQPAEEPTVTTQAVTLIGSVGCTGNGTITDTGGENATRQGFCYVAGTSGDPDTGDDVVYDDGDYGTGAFSKAITGLTGNTSYRVRAYALNSIGTSYGDTVQVTTSPAAPTDVLASADDATKVVVTWTGSDGATAYQVYRDEVGLGWLGDVETYDDEEADPPVITPGSATATDGVYADHVLLDVDDESIANGTEHTYVVKAIGAAGPSPDSDGDEGLRLAGALSYQWMRSEADLSEDFATIVAGTIEAYEDTEAPG